MPAIAIIGVLLLLLAALVLYATPRAAARRLRLSISLARLVTVSLEVDRSADPPP